jgi:hypothetical protein
VSFDQIRKQKPRAAEILSLMAVLDRQGVPKTLLRKDGERGIEFTTALGTLQAFSLVTVEKGGASLEIHRLVQVSTQSWLELQSEIAKWQEEALKVLTAAFPSGNYGTWMTCEALSPHAQAVTQYAFTSNVNLLQCAELLHNMSSYYKGSVHCVMDWASEAFYSSNLTLKSSKPKSFAIWTLN